MKYIYAILPAMLFVLQSSPGQTVPQETSSLSETVSTESIPTQGKNPIPDDVVLGPVAGSALSIGLFGGIISSTHSGTFTIVEEGILCCEFDGASGVGPTIAVRGEYYPKDDRTWGVAARIAWEDQSAEFESDVEQLLIFGENNEPEEADFQNRLDASMTAITISPLFMVRLIDFDLYISAGPAITLYTSPTFDKTERIVGPSGVTYLDGSTETALPDLPMEGINSTGIGFTAGLDLRYPLTERIALGGEIYYRLPVTKITSDGEWKVSNVIAAVGAVFSL